MKNFIEKINMWRIICREYTLHQSIIPYLFAVVLAAKHYNINYLLSFLGLIGVVLAHISVNILDDYFDWKKGAVEEYKKLINDGLQARTHKCFYLEENLVSLNTILFVALSMDAVACLLGLYIALKIGFSVIIIAGLAGLMGFFYSAPPFKLSYRGLGEIAIGIIFGPLLMAGAYITAGGVIDKPIMFSSVIIGLLVANIAHTHAIMDFKSDVKVGKTSLSTFLKTGDNAIFMQGLIFALAYIFLAIGIFMKIFPIESAFVFLTAPKAFMLVKLMKSEYKTKKLWMGLLENWDRHQKEGSDWFMMRLCLSRNIVTDFVVILGITYYIWG